MSPAIIVDGKDINNESIEIFLDEKIAGISNIERLIINLQNEGFKKAYIVANKNLEIKLKKIKTYRIKINYSQRFMQPKRRYIIISKQCCTK